MWQDRDPWQLERCVALIDRELERPALESLYIEQLVRVRAEVTEFLGSLAGDTAVPEPIDSGEEVPEAGSEEEATEQTEPVQCDSLDEKEPLVESGASWLGKNPVSDDGMIRQFETGGFKGIDELHGPVFEQLVRFDPSLGTYNAKGRILADATESPAIKQNIDTLIHAAYAIAEISQAGTTHHITVEDLFIQTGQSDVDAVTRRYIAHELNRILSPTGLIHTGRDRSSGKHTVHMSGPFRFVVTEVQPRRSRRVHTEVQPELCQAVRWDSTDGDDVTQQLCNKQVPRPTDHHQALALLDTLMQGDVLYGQLVQHLTDEESQAVMDLGHAFVQATLGYRAYLLARNERTIRSGRPGFVGRVRQVTGTQQLERFEQRSQAPTSGSL